MANEYVIHLYDSDNGTRAGTVEDFSSLTIVKGISGVESVEIVFPINSASTQKFQHGQVFRVHEPGWVDPTNGSITGKDHASAIVSGPVDYARGDVVTIRATGMIARLADAYFPDEYLLTGTLQANRTRFVRRFDSRVITAGALPVGPEGIEGDEILVFNQPGIGGATASNVTISEREATGEDYESGGYVILTDQDSPGTYDSPLMDFTTTVTAWDRLFFDGGWMNRTDGSPKEEITYRAASVSDIYATPSFTGTTGTEPTDPAGLGEDVSGVSADRFFAVELQFNAFYATDDQYNPYVDYVMVTAQRAFANFDAASGDWPTAVDLERGREVGGMSLIQALSSICEVNGYEYRLLDPDSGQGTTDHLLQVQQIPNTGAIGTVWGTDRTSRYMIVDGKHCAFERLELDDSNLVNYVEAIGTGAGRNALRTVVQDIPSQTEYGVRPRRYQTSKQTLSELLPEARNFLTFFKEPQVMLQVNVRSTPDGTFDFAPGDLIRVLSPMRNFARGASMKALEAYVLGYSGLEKFTLRELEGLGARTLYRENLRIIRETRRVDQEGVSIVLSLENKPRSIVEQLQQRLRSLEEGTRNSVKALRSGEDIVGQFSDGDVHTHTIHLDFTPSGSSSHITEIIDEDGNGTTQDGGVVTVKLVNQPPRLGQNKIEIDFQRTAVAGGYTGEYNLRLQWSAWGREPSAEALTSRKWR